jgi:hypothetical protein
VWGSLICTFGFAEDTLAREKSNKIDCRKTDVAIRGTRRRLFLYQRGRGNIPVMMFFLGKDLVVSEIICTFATE